jgi:hypothetical protein
VDLLTGAKRYTGLAAVREVVTKVRSSLPSGHWPLQPDHVRILESGLRRWARGGFELRRRAWIGKYLTYDYIRSREGAV